MCHKIWLSLMCLVLVHTDPTYHSHGVSLSSPSIFDYYYYTTPQAPELEVDTLPPDELEIPSITLPPEDTSLAQEGITVSPPEATPLASELDITMPLSETTPVDFQSFESRVKSFIYNVNLNQLSAISDTTDFFEEIDKYMLFLPAKKFTKIVTSKSRDSCYCGGAIVSPCPLQCIHSCYVKLDVNALSKEAWVYLNDCVMDKPMTYIFAKECRCYEGSDINCYYQMDSCFNVTIDFIHEPHCSDFHIDKTTLVQSFDLKLNLLIEPLKMYFREVEFRLMSLRRFALSIENRANIWEQNCRSRIDPNCFSDWQFLSAEKQTYDQIKSNITSELIRSQNLIDKVSRNVEELKKLTFSRINQSIKDYSCCLQNLNLTVGHYDCHGVKTVGE